MVTQERLIELLTYDKDSGDFIWNIANSNRVIKGAVAGTISPTTGYVNIGIDGKTYRGHRLAFLYVHGCMPEFVDHINHIRTDNKWHNLREASKVENGRNISMPITNTSGQVGVSFRKDRNRWHAYITVDDKRTNLGNFTEYSEAVNARKNAEALYGFHANHGKG